MKKLGQEPAFPEILLDTYSGKPCGQEHGVSKRFYAACAAMQGLIVGVRSSGDGLNINEITSAAFDFADELLKQEEKQ